MWLVFFQFPVLITIPGNVPHQVHNPYDKDLYWYYFFPEVESTNQMRYFYPCGSHTEIYQRFPSSERSEKQLKHSEWNFCFSFLWANMNMNTDWSDGAFN